MPQKTRCADCDLPTNVTHYGGDAKIPADAPVCDGCQVVRVRVAHKARAARRAALEAKLTAPPAGAAGGGAP